MDLCVCVYVCVLPAQSGRVDAALRSWDPRSFLKAAYFPSTQLTAVSQGLWFIKQKGHRGRLQLILSAFIWCCSGRSLH